MLHSIIRLTDEMHDLAEHQVSSGGSWVMYIGDPLTPGEM